jgi:hypothetical protein
LEWEGLGLAFSVFAAGGDSLSSPVERREKEMAAAYGMVLWN